jgi:YD repeat-containing protein
LFDLGTNSSILNAVNALARRHPCLWLWALLFLLAVPQVSIATLTGLTDAEAIVTQFQYDDAGNQQTIQNRRHVGGTPPAFNGVFAYEHYQDSRLKISSMSLNKTTTLQYNARGLLEKTREPSAQETTFYYDARGRVKNVVDSVNPTLTTPPTFEYNGNGGVEHHRERDPETGLLKDLVRTYDSLNRIQTFSDWNNQTIAYTYDDNGNLQTLTYPGSKTVTYPTTAIIG